MMRCLLLLLLFATACARGETHGFVATLGNDTTSVERITRTGDRITGDAVGRSPVVVRRHWEATVAPDGSLHSWSMDTHIPNAPAGESDLHHEATFASDSIRIVRRTGSGTRNVAYPTRYRVTVPWNAFVYGTYEVMFSAARTFDDSTTIGQYFFEGWDEGNIGRGRVRRLPDGAYSIISSGLAGAGIGRMDEQGRLLLYSGQGTTYKQEVKRIDGALDIDAIAARFAAAEKANGVKRSLSERDTTRATVGNAEVRIDYSRPLARGRQLARGLIPYDLVWRTGANAATQLILSAPVRLGGVALDSGTYTLWTLPTARDVTLIINSQAGQWGTSYRSASDIARVPMLVETNATSVERFTIRIASERLVMEWGTFRWSVPIEAH